MMSSNVARFITRVYLHMSCKWKNQLMRYYCFDCLMHRPRKLLHELSGTESDLLSGKQE